MTAPGRTCWRWFAAQWRDCKKSWIAPFSAIIIITIIIIIIIIIINSGESKNSYKDKKKFSNSDKLTKTMGDFSFPVYILPLLSQLRNYS